MSPAGSASLYLPSGLGRRNASWAYWVLGKMEIRVECGAKLFKSLVHFLYKIGKLKVRWQDIKDADTLVLVLKRPKKKRPGEELAQLSSGIVIRHRVRKRR